MDGHKQLDVVERHEKFLNKMKNLEPYVGKFEEDGLMKIKNYLDDYIVRGDIHCLIIIITHNEYTFFINNKI